MNLNSFFQKVDWNQLKKTVIIRLFKRKIERKAISLQLEKQRMTNNTDKINPQDTKSHKSHDKMRREKLPGLKLIPHRVSNKENLIPHLTG